MLIINEHAVFLNSFLKMYYILIMKTFFLISILLAFSIFSISAQESPEAGTIVYLEGDVDVYRDGEIIDRSIVDIGFPVEIYDIIETKSDSMAEISMTDHYGGDSRIIVKPGTVFAVEYTEKAGSRQNLLQMMKGSIGARIKRLAGTEGFMLKTGSAVMGVRGTSFDVLESPEGGILVTCDEGKVSCRDIDGNEVIARPGSAVENVAEKDISVLNVAVEDIELYQQFWMKTRQEVFRNGAEVFIKSYVNQYMEALPRFLEAYRELTSERGTLEKYGIESKGFSLGDLINAKTAATPSVVKMRGTLPLFEMVYFRLQELKGYHDQGLGYGRLESGLTTEDFFRDFSKQSAGMNLFLSDTRYLLKLYFNIHEASGGGPSIMDDPFGGDPLFQGPPGKSGLNF